MNRIRRVALVWIAIALSACTSSLNTGNSETAVSSLKGNPNAVYVFRDTGWTNAAVSMLISLNGAEIGKIGTNGNSFVFAAPAGTNSIFVEYSPWAVSSANAETSFTNDQTSPNFFIIQQESSFDGLSPAPLVDDITLREVDVQTYNALVRGS